MKMSKEKRALIAGMIGCLLYVIGDFLFAATGKTQSTESIGLMVKVAYLDMATWRMVVSIICGVLGTALYYIGFHQMWKLLKIHLTQPKQQKWVKLFQIAYLTGMSTAGEAPIRRSPTVDAVWSAFAERCALRFLYQNGRGEQRERTVCVYGMFEREGTAYFCGLDNATDSIRTFRCDRIIRAWRPSKAYAIPADFNLNDYLFFEFDFADRPPIAATFSFAREAQADMVSGLTRGRGELVRTEAGWTWTVNVRDLEAAASFCMAHAVDGMRPVAPDSLKQAWNHLIERTVHEHARA